MIVASSLLVSGSTDETALDPQQGRHAIEVVRQCAGALVIQGVPDLQVT